MYTQSDNSNLVTVFILNWDRKAETCRAIESAINQTHPSIEVLVVDNGSTDGSSEYIKNRYPQIKFIQLDQNYGCPGGRNRGIPYCNGEFIFFCDNDGVLHTKAVENAINCIAQDPKIGVVAGVVKHYDLETDINTSFILPPLTLKETNLFSGGISLHRRSIYSEIGNYPDDYMYGAEETYLSYRILDADYKIVKSEQVILWHKQSELARNFNKDTVQSWGNVLMNAYQLFPIEHFIIYFIYFISRYPVYAFRHKVLGMYSTAFFIYLKRFRKYKRKPVKRSTFRKFSNMVS